MPDAPQEVWDEINAEIDKEGQEYERLLTEHVQKYEADNPESATEPVPAPS